MAKNQNEILTAQFKALENIQKQYEAINEVQKKGLDFSQKELKLLEEGATELEIQNAKLNDEIALNEKNLQTTQRQLEEVIKIKEKLDEISMLKGQLTEDEEGLLQLAIKQQEESELLLKKLGEIAKKKKEENESVAKGAKASRETVESTKKLLGNLTGINGEGKKFVKMIADQGGLSGFFKNIGQGIKETITPMNIFYSGLEKVQEASLELIREQDAAVSSFNKSTGAAGEYDNMIRDLGHAHLALGIDTADAAKAVQSLREDFSGFTLQTKATQKELALFASSMEKLGIDSHETAKFIQLATKSLSMTTDEAMKSQREMLSLSRSLGVAPAKMVGDFGNAMTKLSAHGKNGIKVFKEMAVAAKATGLEISDLLSITEQFDTFEGAADSVGKLNAILRGPYLDSMQMVMMDENERIRALRDAVNQSGTSWESMTRYQQKALTSAMGMKDVAEMGKLLSGNIDEISAAAKKEAATQAEMNEMIKQTNGLMDKLKSIAMSFAISMGPVIDAFKTIIDKVLALNLHLGEYLIPTLVLLAGAVVLIISVKKAWIAITSAWKTVVGIVTFFSKKKTAAVVADTVAEVANSAATATNSAMQSASVAPITASGNAARMSATGMLALGLAILMIGAGIGLAMLGIAQLALSLKGLSGAQMVTLIVMMGILAATFIVLGYVGLSAGTGVAYLGLGMLLLGAGIFLAAAGVALLVNAIKGLTVEQMGALTAMLPAVVALMGMFALSLMGVAAFGALAGMSLVAVALGMGGLAISLALIKTADLQAVSNMFVAMAKLSASTASSIRGISAAIKEMLDVVEHIPTDKTVKVTQLLEQVEKSRNAGAARSMATANAITSASSQGEAPGSPGSTSGDGQRTIILQLDGRTLKKFVIDVMDDKLNPRKI